MNLAKAIDYTHLSTQAGGDEALMREVLELFVSHGEQVLEALSTAPSAKEWHDHAHSLKGSARGVGAHAVADAASCAELSPMDHAVLRRLQAAFAEARAEILPEKPV
ncbi:MAG TPA: hypothetical protein DCL54_00395 [Alphaproteobacteria bacterium]|nr:hypothetical protein [Alphaproteobacteria bacterium]